LFVFCQVSDKEKAKRNQRVLNNKNW